MNKKNLIPVLLFLFIIAFFMRFYLLPQNLFFGPEQGIDFMEMRKVAVDHNFTLIGAKTDVSGVFHGPIYYYLSVIPFLLSGGDPLVISAFFVFINSLTVFFIYFLGREIGGARLGLISAVLFAISFEALIYPRWLSAHPLSIPLVTLFFFFFYRFIKGSKKDIVFAAIALGLLNQVEFLHIIFYGMIALVLIIVYFKKIIKTKPAYLLSAVFLAFIITFGTYILFDFRHDFLISKNVFALAFGGTGFHIGYFQALSEIFSAVTRVFMRTIFPTGMLGASLIFMSALIIVYLKFREDREKIMPLIIWFAVPIVLLIIFRHNILDQFFVSFIPLFILITALFVDSLWQKRKVLALAILTVIIFSNFFIWNENVPGNKNIFFQSTQPDLKYKDQLATIDAVYKDLQGEEFSIQTYTIPYWTQQGWHYLFWSYGLKNYGYEPIAQNSDTLFVIIQDDPSNRPFQDDWLKNTVTKWGTPVTSFEYGILKTLKLNTTNEE